MSNFLAVATVTAAIQRLLQGPVAADVPGAMVTTERPASPTASTTPTVNLFLYQVAPSAARRNDDLPSRRGDATLVERPRAAVDLHYLISFSGDDGELASQRLLGSTIRTLTARPVLGTELFDEVVAAAGANPPVHPTLVQSDLGDVDEPVRLTQVPLDLEVLSKLWSVFLQTPYALSVAWSASVVFLEESTVTSPALPVLAPALSVGPLRRPAVTAVAVRDEPSAPVTTDRTIVLTGTQLAGEDTIVRFGGTDLVPASSTDRSLVVDLADAPPGVLRAGPTALVVVHRRAAGVPPTPRDEAESRPVVVTVHPRLTGAAVAAGRLELDCDPPIAPRQEAVVRLCSPGTTQTVALLAVASPSAAAESVGVELAGVAPGPYDVVLVVAGASSGPASVVVAP